MYRDEPAGYLKEGAKIALAEPVIRPRRAGRHNVLRYRDQA
jgi:hypothetical protein